MRLISGLFVWSLILLGWEVLAQQVPSPPPGWNQNPQMQQQIPYNQQPVPYGAPGTMAPGQTFMPQQQMMAPPLVGRSEIAYDEFGCPINHRFDSSAIPPSAVPGWQGGPHGM